MFQKGALPGLVEQAGEQRSGVQPTRKFWKKVGSSGRVERLELRQQHFHPFYELHLGDGIDPSESSILVVRRV